MRSKEQPSRENNGGAYIRIYKTENGREEVHLRSQRLTARERAALVMVDGKRSVADLCMMSPTPAEIQQHLHTFLEADLIAAAGKIAQDAALHETASAEREFADNLTDMNVRSQIYPSAASAGADLEKARQYILEVAEETLGPRYSLFDRSARAAAQCRRNAEPCPSPAMCCTALPMSRKPTSSWKRYARSLPKPDFPFSCFLCLPPLRFAAADGLSHRASSLRHACFLNNRCLPSVSGAV